MIGPDEEGMGPAERGIQRYKQKNYKGALEAFSEAINFSTGHIKLKALDHRAATYEKLGQLQQALRDSRDMIILKPELSMGYLRCAKILQVQGKKTLALQIYEKGLKKVKFGTDEQRNTLQAMFNKLSRLEGAGKCLDPLQYLPLELAHMVAQNLEMNDLVVCLRVSPAWKRLLESSHKLWTTLDTETGKKSITQNSLRLHLRRSNYTLESAIINSKAQFDAKKWNYLLKNCKKLNTLKINGTGVIGSSLTDAIPLALSLTSITVSGNCEISLSAIGLILRSCQNTLVDAAFLSIKGSRHHGTWPRIESLQSLDMRTKEGATSMPIELLEFLPNLKSLTLVGWPTRPWLQIDLSNFEHLEAVAFVDSGLSVLPKLPSTIRSLNLRKNLHLKSLINDEETKPCEFPFLERLDCSETSLLGEIIKEITNHSIKAGNLKRLHIGSRLVDEGRGPATDEYPASGAVKELSLSGSNLTERRVLDIINLYPNVQRLDVSKTKVTGVAVKHFVTMGVKWLTLNDCSEMSMDAVDYARGKDVEVEFRKSNSESRGWRDTVGSAL